MTNDVMVGQLEAFFRSSATNVEVMPSDLRKALTIPTPLESAVRASVKLRRDVVVAGTAGSGKTHLLEQIGRIEKYNVVTDLAALSEGEWAKLFGGRMPVIVAGNEGAFLQGARKGFRGFQEVVDRLHAIQRGEDKRYVDGPVVIDAAGFDPSGHHVVANMLEHKLVGTLLERAEVALRKSAWTLFEQPKVGRRVALLVQAGSAESEADGFTFRQLWQFVADLALQGEGTQGLWFFRVVYGDSEVSRRIRGVFSPRYLALPHIGNRLWHGDVMGLERHLFPQALDVIRRILPPNFVERSESERREFFDVLRLLLAFGLKESPLDRMLDMGANVWDRVRRLEPRPLLEAINRYMTYSLTSLGDDLELWMQHDTERRLSKPDTQVSLGAVAADRFELRRNRVVANAPAGVDHINGGRVILMHKESGASLAVTKDLVDGVLQSRSHRMAERRHVEFDWRLMRFFAEVAKAEARPDRLRVMACDFQGRKGQLVTWKVGDGRVQRVSGA